MRPLVNVPGIETAREKEKHRHTRLTIEPQHSRKPALEFARPAVKQLMRLAGQPVAQHVGRKQKLLAHSVAAPQKIVEQAVEPLFKGREITHCFDNLGGGLCAVCKKSAQNSSSFEGK